MVLGSHETCMWGAHVLPEHPERRHCCLPKLSKRIERKRISIRKEELHERKKKYFEKTKDERKRQKNMKTCSSNVWSAGAPDLGSVPAALGMPNEEHQLLPWLFKLLFKLLASTSQKHCEAFCPRCIARLFHWRTEPSETSALKETLKS